MPVSRTEYIEQQGFLTDLQMFERYQTKEKQFKQLADITLIGHSLFDMWSDCEIYPPNLKSKSIANLGISGISSFQYLDILIRPQYIEHLGKTVFVFLGVNDILKEIEYSPKKVSEWLTEIFDCLVGISPESQYFLLELTPVLNCEKVKNTQIQELNSYLKSHCPKRVNFIETYRTFADEQHNLRRELTTDGVHFTAKAYELLRSVLLPHIPD